MNKFTEEGNKNFPSFFKIAVYFSLHLVYNIFIKKVKGKPNKIQITIYERLNLMYNITIIKVKETT